MYTIYFSGKKAVTREKNIKNSIPQEQLEVKQKGLFAISKRSFC